MKKPETPPASPHVFPEKVYVKMPSMGLQEALKSGSGPRVGLTPGELVYTLYPGESAHRVGVYRLVGELEIRSRAEVITISGEP